MRRMITVGIGVILALTLLGAAPAGASLYCEQPSPTACREHVYTRAAPGQVLTVMANNDTNRSARVIITLQRRGDFQVERTFAAFTVPGGEPFAFTFAAPASWRHVGIAHAYIAQGPPVCVDDTGELLSVSII